jgi:hypothetical protein
MILSGMPVEDGPSISLFYRRRCRKAVLELIDDFARLNCPSRAGFWRLHRSLD